MSIRAQYVKSTDPDVIRIITENDATRRIAHEAALAWAEKYGATGYYGGSRWGHFSVYAIATDEKPTDGQWKPGVRGRGWAPYKNNPVRADMEALSATFSPVPGLGDYFEALRDGGVGGQVWMMWPVPFLANGAAYVMLGHYPTQGEFGDEWSEIKASEAYAAKESYESEGTA